MPLSAPRHAAPPTSHTDRLARRALVGAVLMAAALGACRHRDAGAAEREAERAEIRAAAERAARMAAGGDDTGTGARARRDTGARLNMGLGDDARLSLGNDPPLGAGDVRVTSTDGAVVLAVIGDTVRMRLGDSLAVKVRREMAADTDTSSGFGGVIARTVTAAVGTAMGEATRFAVRVPVTEVRDLRYEDGELRFSTRAARRAGDRKGDGGTHSNARFAPADAERFIAAVRARQRALGVRN